MEFIGEYLAHWSVFVMMVGLILLIGGMVTLLIPVFKAINEFLKVRTDKNLTKADE